MTKPLIDLSYILEISGNDSEYIYEIAGIFLDTMSSGLPVLQKLVMETNDYEKIHKQAHFLKSSAGIIKVRNNYENLIRIDQLAHQKANIEEIKALLIEILANYEEAIPAIHEIRASHQQ